MTANGKSRLEWGPAQAERMYRSHYEEEHDALDRVRAIATLEVFAEWCRENCGQPGQSGDGRLCGEQKGTMTTFCGHHMGAVMGVE